MRKILALILAVAMIFVIAACATTEETPTTTDQPAVAEPATPAEPTEPTTPAEPAEKEWRIVTVVKLTGVTWFDRLEEGIISFASDTGIDSTMIGPATADVALQVQMVEDLIAQGVDAICVVPISAEAMDPVLRRAMDEGIVVISHEAPDLVNIDFNIEAFDNTAFGEAVMKVLAEEMGGEGEYVTSVGHLTATSHNLWEEGAVAYQEANYPNMVAVQRKIENHDDQMVIYDRIREVMKAHPNVTGIVGMGSESPPGAALAIEEMGLSGVVKIVGTGIASVSGSYIKDGTIQAVATWDPRTSGYAMSLLAQMILEGRGGEIVDGANLGLPGYESIKIIDGKYIEGNDILIKTKENLADYNF